MGNLVGVEMKYVRLEEYDSIIIFPTIIQHNKFKYLNIISAGFCVIKDTSIKCYGESISLDLKSKPEDSSLATKQSFSDIEYK